MKKSKYTYFFEIENEYVGYSFLENTYLSSPIEQKERIERLLTHPDAVFDDFDVSLYKKLCDKKFIIKDDFDEYNYVLNVNRKFTYRTDCLYLDIVPTMSCNCKCYYCYELHPSLIKSKMTKNTVSNIKNYIEKKINNINSVNIGWFGGEPLLCVDIVEEIQKFCFNLCQKKGVLFYSGMSTNGLLLNQKNAKILTENGLNEIHVTFDGSKKKHDQTRITLNNGKTFDVIFKNILYFLDLDKKNLIILRIHLSPMINKNEIEKIKETLLLFDVKYRKQIKPYPHFLFNSCNETWAKDLDNNNKYRGCPIDNKNFVIDKINEVIAELGFHYSKGFLNQSKYYLACKADLDEYWVVRPDGFLNKCTVGIEKERSQAKLTEHGIKIFPERYFKTISKRFSSILYENCKDCSNLPFCWQGCMFKHYQSPDIYQFIKNYCSKNKIEWGIKRELNNIKYHYLLNKRGRNENF